MAKRRRKAKKTRGRKKARRKKSTKRARGKKKTTKKRRTKGRKKARRKTTGRKKTKRAKGRKKARRKTTKRKTKRKPSKAFMAPMQPSAALADVIGSRAIPRTQVVKKLWQYIKKRKLQDPKNRRNIRADAKLQKVFKGKKVVNMFQMTKLVNKNLKKAA